MCGRLICVLDGPNLALRCRWKPPKGSEQKHPQWEGEPPKPSYNIPPTSQVPVLYGKFGDRKLRSMRWGLVPSTYQGELKEFKLPTHNCRGETIPERPMFQRPFKRGLRGVIPANGFFEWTSAKGSEKIPHLVHAKTDAKEEQVESEAKIIFQKKVEDNPLLMIAALYDIRKLPSGESFYSVAVVTVNASESISWLHHRMPALLETPEEVQQWLHTGSMIAHTVLPLLHPRTSVSLFPVSKAVNSVQTQGEQCIQEMAPVIKKPTTTIDKFFSSPDSKPEKKFLGTASPSPRSSQKRKTGTLETFFKKRKLSEDC